MSVMPVVWPPSPEDAADTFPFSAFQAAPVWRAGEMAAAVQHTLDTGYPALNAALPGGGWPVGAMTELLQAQPGCGEWGLLAPVLAASCVLTACSAVVLIGAPFVPCGPALASRQIDPSRLLRVQADVTSARLWAAEQALRCADVSAVLAWLPKVPLPHLRRLQMAAQSHGKLLFVFRPETVQADSSPAPLRLRLMRAGLKTAGSPGPEQSATGQGTAPGLLVDVFKRRGPPLAQPLLLPTLPLRLEALLAASRAQARRRHQMARAVAIPAFAPGPASRGGSNPAQKESGHAVGRLASHS
jgi:protein ImuA